TGTFLRAYAAAARGVEAAGDRTIPGLRDRVAILEAVAAAHAKKYDQAIAALTPPAAAEATRAKPVGPPVSKPTHELFGEILLSAGKPKEAVAQFKIALERHPGRALSLLGLARAEAVVGNKPEARIAYGRLLGMWKNADADLPELAEVKAFVQANG
ncbi:MAG: tetratricopeptide repeat protein, partial [Opitutaceae bacterium]